MSTARTRKLKRLARSHAQRELDCILFNTSRYIALEYNAIQLYCTRKQREPPGENPARKSPGNKIMQIRSSRDTARTAEDSSAKSSLARSLVRARLLYGTTFAAYANYPSSQPRLSTWSRRQRLSKLFPLLARQRGLRNITESHQP